MASPTTPSHRSRFATIFRLGRRRRSLADSESIVYFLHRHSTDHLGSRWIVPRIDRFQIVTVAECHVHFVDRFPSVSHLDARSRLLLGGMKYFFRGAGPEFGTMALIWSWFPRRGSQLSKRPSTTTSRPRSAVSSPSSEGHAPPFCGTSGSPHCSKRWLLHFSVVVFPLLVLQRLCPLQKRVLGCSAPVSLGSGCPAGGIPVHPHAVGNFSP